MKQIVTIVLIITLGVLGFLLFFGDNDNMTILLLSKPAGIMLLTASYMLHKSLKNETKSIIQNNK